MRRRYLRYGLILVIVIAAVVAVLLIRHREKGNAPDVAADGKPVVYVQKGLPNAVPTIAWSRDGRHILLSDRNVVLLCDARSGRELHQLKLPVTADAPLAFLPDGERFLMGGIDSTVQLRDVATFRELKSFRMGAPVRSLAIPSRGNTMLCTTTSRTAYLWDVKTGRELRRFPTGPAGSIVAAMSADGGLLLIQGTASKTVTLWNADNGQKVRDFQMSVATPMCAAFSSDGKRIACGSGDVRTRLLMCATANFSPSFPDSAQIRVWNAANGELICSSQPDSAYTMLSVQFDPDGRHLFTAAVDSTVNCWDLETCSLSSQLSSHENLVEMPVLSADGRRMLTAGDRNMRIWDIADRQVVRTFPARVLADCATSISPDGKKIYVAPWWNETKGMRFCQRVFVWDAQTGRRLDVLDPQPTRECYAFSDDCRQAMVMMPSDRSDSGDFQFWNAERGLLGCPKPTHPATIMTGPWGFTTDGRYAAANVDDSSYVLWETETGREIRRIHCAEPPWIGAGWLDVLSLSDDGRYAVVARQPAALLLDFTTAMSRVIRSTRGSTASISDCRISSDGQLAVFTWSDHSVDVRDVSSLKLLHSYVLEGFGENKGTIGWIRISRDNRTFIASRWPWTEEHAVNESGAVDTLLLFWPRVAGMWDLPTGKLLREYGKNTGGVFSLQFSNDERLLTGNTLDAGTWIFNAETGKEVVHLLSFENGEWLAVTPEGYYTASLNGDQFLNVRTGTKITGIEPYRSTFYQPAVVEAALRLGDSELAISEVLGCKTSCTTIADLPEIEPPFLAVKYPENGDTLHTVDTTLAFHVEDRRYPIASVKVYVNARPITGNPTRDLEEEPVSRSIQLDVPKGKKALDLKVPLRLDEGDNLITITATGKSEAVDSLHLFVIIAGTLPEQMEMDTVWILAVGVNNYQDKKLRRLNYCVNDAQGIIEAFTAQEGKTCRKVMSLCISDAGPKKPTYETIVDNIGFLQQAAEHDLVILFLAGHGVNDVHGDFYFLPSDAEVTGPQEFRKSKAISGAQLQTAVDVSARRFVFMDACHSGDVGVDLVKLAREFKDNRVLIMTSSEGNKPSEEADSLKHGLFTYTLIQGLQGDADRMEIDGKVSAMELTTYVSERVAVLTRHRQNPVFWAPGGLSNFVVAVKRTELASATGVE